MIREKILVSRELVVKPRFELQRLDQYLVRQQIHPSRTTIQRLIKEGEIHVNGKRVKPHYKIRTGDHLVCRIPTPKPLELIPEAIPLDILYEDPAIIVLNKPAGLVMHPAPGHDTGTLVHALLAHCHDLSGIGGRTRPGLVHRLDKDTSGVIVVAKSDAAHRDLSRQFKAHSILRVYRAIVVGRLLKKTGTIHLAIGRDRWHRKKISSRTTKPREASTAYHVIETFGSASYVEVRPRTGRTHQIRVHFASLRHPILGDSLYGHQTGISETVRADRQMLHAERLGFQHPIHKKFTEFSAPPPSDMKKVLNHLRKLSRHGSES